MIKIVRFLSILMIFMLSVTACGQKVGSLFPIQQTLEPTAQYKADKVDQYFKNEIPGIEYPEEATLYGAALISQNGTVLLDKGYGFADRENQVPNSPTTRFRLGRISMIFASLATWMLYEQGKLDPQDEMCNFIENCPENWKDIVILDLLNNTSGIDDFWHAEGYAGVSPGSISVDDLIEQIKSIYLFPGQDPSTIQGDSNYVLLMKIIEKASGKPYETFLKVNILDPLGMKNTGVLHNAGKDDQLAVLYRDPGEDSVVNIDSMFEMYYNGGLFSILGMYSTVEDCYLLIEALKQNQILNSEKIMSLRGEKDVFAWFTDNDDGLGSGWVAWQFPDIGPTYTSLWTEHYLDGPGLGLEPGTGIVEVLLTNQNSSVPAGMRDITDFLAGRESGIK